MKERAQEGERGWEKKERRWVGYIGVGCLLFFISGCSIQKALVHQAAGSLAGPQTTAVFASDDDPELVGQALPFALKLQEVLLAQDPKNPDLLLSTGSAFVQYAYAYVQDRADAVEETNFTEAAYLRRRAVRLYRRALRYLLQGLEVRHPGFRQALEQDPTNAVQQLTKADMPWIYWSAVAWGALISLSKDDPMTLSELPQLDALVRRAEALDPDWGRGALQTFLIQYDMAQIQGSQKEAVQKAWNHFRRAVLLSKGMDAAPFVTMAEAVAVQTQNVQLFETLLRQALAIDPDLYPQNRLMNLVMQRRARRLLQKEEELFLILPSNASQPKRKQ